VVAGSCFILPAALGAGAALATLGIFLPAFVFVTLSAPLVPRPAPLADGRSAARRRRRRVAR